MKRNKSAGFQLFIILILGAFALFILDRSQKIDGMRFFLEERMATLRLLGVSQTSEQEMSTLSSKVVSLETQINMLKDENSSLRRQLGAPLSPSFTFVPARVIAVTADGNEKTMLIAAGRSNNVFQNMPVVVDNVLVGVVSRETPGTATVRLLSSSNSTVSVTTDRNAKGLVIGSNEENADTAILDRVLQQETLVEGDKIMTAGSEEIPPDLIVGTVSAVLTEDREPFQKARIRLLIDPTDLTRVFVLRKE